MLTNTHHSSSALVILCYAASIIYWTMPRPLIYCLISLLIWHRVSSLIATPPSGVHCNNYRASKCTSNFNHKLSTRNRRRRLISQRRRYTLLQSAAHDRISNSHIIIDSESSANHTANNRIEEVSKTTHQLSSDDDTSPQSSDNTHNIIDKQPLLTDLPKHVAFICDGNSRWAQSNSLHESLGHVAGADRVVSLIKTLQCLRIDTDNALPSTTARQSSIDIEDSQSTNQQRKKQTRIEYCTLFAFSTENWSRPQLEITALFKLITQTAIKYQSHSSILNGMIQITLLGNIYDNRIPDDMRSALLELVKVSTDACNERRRRRRRLLQDEEGEDDDRDTNDDDDILTICLAINYGGRADILQAAASLAQSIASGEVTLDNSNNNDDTTQQQQLENLISSRLSTSTIPDPDLIIRTGGEYRLSNFLLWNVAYTELYFSDVLWPDFDNDELIKALRWYGLRNRRFGGR